MVVPNWHGGNPIASHPPLIELLRAQVTGGSEVVLHGLEHRARGQLSGAWLDRRRAGRPEPRLPSWTASRAWLPEGGSPPPMLICMEPRQGDERAGSVAVSVVIPARNEEAYLEAALASVAEQRYPPSSVDCVVADN